MPRIPSDNRPSRNIQPRPHGSSVRRTYFTTERSFERQEQPQFSRPHQYLRQDDRYHPYGNVFLPMNSVTYLEWYTTPMDRRHTVNNGNMHRSLGYLFPQNWQNQRRFWPRSQFYQRESQGPLYRPGRWGVYGITIQHYYRQERVCTPESHLHHTANEGCSVRGHQTTLDLNTLVLGNVPALNGHHVYPGREHQRGATRNLPLPVWDEPRGSHESEVVYANDESFGDVEVEDSGESSIMSSFSDSRTMPSLTESISASGLSDTNITSSLDDIGIASPLSNCRTMTSLCEDSSPLNRDDAHLGHAQQQVADRTPLPVRFEQLQSPEAEVVSSDGGEAHWTDGPLSAPGEHQNSVVEIMPSLNEHSALSDVHHERADHRRQHETSSIMSLLVGNEPQNVTRPEFQAEATYTNFITANTVLYNYKKVKSAEHCSVCLSSLMEGEVVRQLKCLHVFHKDCIDQWLLIKMQCVLCRSPIAEGLQEILAAQSARIEEEAHRFQQTQFPTEAVHGSLRVIQPLERIRNMVSQRPVDIRVEVDGRPASVSFRPANITSRSGLRHGRCTRCRAATGTSSQETAASVGEVQPSSEEVQDRNGVESAHGSSRLPERTLTIDAGGSGVRLPVSYRTIFMQNRRTGQWMMARSVCDTCGALIPEPVRLSQSSDARDGEGASPFNVQLALP